MSNLFKLKNYLKSNNMTIDIEGNIKKNYDYIINITANIIFILYIYIIYKESIKKNTIIIYSTTIYSAFVEFMLNLNNKEYIKLNNSYVTNIGYYTAVDNNLIYINPQLNDFLDIKVPLIPLSEEEIEALEKHTGIDNLVRYQNKILDICSEINAYQIIKHYQKNKNYEICNNIIKNKDYYIVTTDKKKYKNNFILTDYVEPLKPNDVINLSCYIPEQQAIYFEPKYIVDNKYKLQILSDNIDKNINILPFFSLDVPREKISFHPFHLPKASDYVLSIMILTQAYIDLL
jgi:hypothetical protein